MSIILSQAHIFTVCFIFTASNPPPFCIPIPVPYVPITILDMCIRLFDITIDFTKMHVCMDWDTRVDKAPVLVSVIRDI